MTTIAALYVRIVGTPIQHIAIAPSSFLSSNLYDMHDVSHIYSVCVERMETTKNYVHRASPPMLMNFIDVVCCGWKSSFSPIASIIMTILYLCTLTKHITSHTHTHLDIDIDFELEQPAQSKVETQIYTKTLTSHNGAKRKTMTMKLTTVSYVYNDAATVTRLYIAVCASQTPKCHYHVLTVFS